MKYILIMLLMLVIFITLLLFGAHNNQILSFNYLLNKREFRASTLLSLIFLAGFIIGWITCGLFWLRTSLALVYAKREVKRLTQQQIAQTVNVTSNNRSNNSRGI
ncbi:LapA family protein [Candidatus Palibaumannia cicadellinicola]|uniref:Probable lipopolysaccharide assembly protein A n=1 Tax=Candidatus Palibaumannia cicadellinicola TaxID=186490 RepID=A0A088MY47_9GAMM|nr:lipopolysaccharide assembly protein LapA domain-containing protein [Candidatus Baumannia cicadellinicola]AIN47217.1 Inner membrane protein yciS [Candidatus Baumannia cicadellinicola]